MVTGQHEWLKVFATCFLWCICTRVRSHRKASKRLWSNFKKRVAQWGGYVVVVHKPALNQPLATGWSILFLYTLIVWYDNNNDFYAITMVLICSTHRDIWYHVVFIWVVPHILTHYAFEKKWSKFLKFFLFHILIFFKRLMCQLGRNDTN